MRAMSSDETLAAALQGKATVGGQDVFNLPSSLYGFFFKLMQGENMSCSQALIQ